MNPGYPNPPPGYGWPQQPGYPGGPPFKTSTPRTLGTLSMVFGGLVTVTSFVTLLLGKQLGSFSVQPGQRAAFERYYDELHTFSMVQGAIMLGMSIALFYIGTGQRSYQRWAVGASVKWSLAAFAVIVFNAIGTFAVVMPAMERLLQDISHGNLDSTPIAMGMKIGIFFGIGANLPYPIILFTAFRKPQNIDAMDEPKLPVAEIHKS